MSAMTCPWCQAPRAEGPSCLKCGANYAKAEAIKQKGRAMAAPAPAPAAPAFESKTKDLAPLSEYVDPDKAIDVEGEWKLCLVAIPGALLVALALHFVLPSLQRIVFAMPLHELGHAVSGWLCGLPSIPMLWVTSIPGERSLIVPLAVAGVMGFLALRAWRAEKGFYAALCAAVLALAAIGTFVLKPKTVQMLAVFAGDGLGLVFSTLLMASFFFGKGTQLYQGSLRWGFVFIGASAFIDMYAVWWGARKDFGLIPFGEQERAGLSDATKLVDVHGWTADQLVHRYVVLGVVCLVVLAAIYAWGVWRAWRYAQK